MSIVLNFMQPKFSCSISARHSWWSKYMSHCRAILLAHMFPVGGCNFHSSYFSIFYSISVTSCTSMASISSTRARMVKTGPSTLLLRLSAPQAIRWSSLRGMGSARVRQRSRQLTARAKVSLLQPKPWQISIIQLMTMARRNQEMSFCLSTRQQLQPLMREQSCSLKKSCVRASVSFSAAMSSVLASKSAIYSAQVFLRVFWDAIQIGQQVHTSREFGFRSIVLALQVRSCTFEPFFRISFSPQNSESPVLQITSVLPSFSCRLLFRSMLDRSSRFYLWGFLVLQTLKCREPSLSLRLTWVSSLSLPWLMRGTLLLARVWVWGRSTVSSLEWISRVWSLRLFSSLQQLEMLGGCLGLQAGPLLQWGRGCFYGAILMLGWEVFFLRNSRSFIIQRQNNYLNRTPNLTIIHIIGAMHSDDEDFKSPEADDEFVTHPPSTRSHSPHPPPDDHIANATHACHEIRHKVMSEQVKKFSQQLIMLIKDNFNKEKKAREGNKWKLIIPITLKKNQEKHLKQFMTELVKMVSELGEIEEEDQEIVSDASRSLGRFFKNSRKVNVMKGEFDEIRTIALRLHQKYKGIQVDNDLMIYCNTTITNLSPSNSYIFEEGLTDCNCMLILPTYHNFELCNYYISSKIELIPISLYKNRELFCEFFYRCICDPRVMAYLPAGSLELIADLEAFPISYSEGARRLIFCIQKMMFLLEQRKMKLEFVNISELFEVIEKAFKRSFKIFYQGKTTDKNIKNILSEDQIYNPLDRFFNKIEHYQIEDGGEKDENALIKIIKERLIRYLKRDDTLKHYAAILQNPNHERKPKKRSKDIQKRLKVTNTNLEGQHKNSLELALTEIIRAHTQKIRTQAKRISWEEIRFTDRIRPMIPYDIHRSVCESKQHAAILHFIESQYTVSLAKVIKQFCSEESPERMSYGELIYLLKDLEVYGLADVVYRGLTPKVSPAFFPKAKFANRLIK